MPTLLAMSLTACQDIKDTYADLTGDGEIRYIGMCNDLTVSPGWQRLIVDWTNNIDPIISKIKIKWKSDDMADSTYLEPGTKEYSISNLPDGTYQITLCSIDKDGNESLANTIYGRPYSDNHEEVLSFSRIIAKQYFLGNDLILLFSGWQDGIESAVLKYTKKDGTAGEFTINKSIATQPLFVLPEEIDPSKPVTLYRTGRIGTCTDLITFAPYELTHGATYTADLKDFLKTKYGISSNVINADGEIKQSWAENVTSLELDTDISSLEDLLTMPKLKKLILGKHTFLTAEGAEDETRGQYKLYDSEISNKVLDLMHKHTGLVVERYANHYKNIKKATYVKEMGLPTLPELDCYDLSKASVTMSPEDDEGYDSHVKNLFDGKSSTCWKPFALSSQNTYVFTVDLGKEVDASGVKIVQKTFDDSQENSMAPQKITMQYADKSGGFKDVTYVTENYIGTSSGQVILLPFAGGKKKVRYLKFSVLSQNYFTSFDVTLAEVGLYK